MAIGDEKYLLDNDISYRIAHALTALGAKVTPIRDVYGADAKDQDWIPRAAADGYIVVSVDSRMIRDKALKRVLKSSKVKALFLGPFFSNLSMWKKATWLIDKWESIEGFMNPAATGTIAEMKQRGRINPRTL